MKKYKFTNLLFNRFSDIKLNIIEDNSRKFMIESDSWFCLHMNIANKKNCKFRITEYPFEERQSNCSEIIIEFYLPSCFEWETFFEGFVEKEEELLTVFKCLGLIEKI